MSSDQRNAFAFCSPTITLTDGNTVTLRSRLAREHYYGSENYRCVGGSDIDTTSRNRGCSSVQCRGTIDTRIRFQRSNTRIRQQYAGYSRDL